MNNGYIDYNCITCDVSGIYPWIPAIAVCLLAVTIFFLLYLARFIIAYKNESQ